MRLLPPAGPGRTLALVALVDRCGTGIYFTLSALYFTRILGFTPLQVGTGLSAAAAVGLVGGVPLGHLADRLGSRRVLVWAQAASGVASAALLLARTYPLFLLAAAAYSLSFGAAATARNALVAQIMTGPKRAEFRAYLRAVTNTGMAIGTGIAAIALHLDTAAGYRAVLWLNVASFAVITVMAASIVEPAATESATRPRVFDAFRDGRAVLFTVLTSLMMVHYFVLEIGIPLWVVGHTEAPKWLVSALLLMNTLVCVVAQVAVARRVSTVPSAVRALARSGWFLLAGCVVVAAAAGRGPVGAGAVLVVGAGLLVAGELWQASGNFVLTFDLARPEAMAAYQGLFGMSYQLAAIIAPTLIALLPIGLGAPGWWLLGAILLGASLLAGPVARSLAADRLVAQPH